MNANTMANSGQIMSALMVMPFMVKMDGWCSVFHHSTEKWMIGRFTVPTSASTAAALSPRSGSSNASPRAR